MCNIIVTQVKRKKITGGKSVRNSGLFGRRKNLVVVEVAVVDEAVVEVVTDQAIGVLGVETRVAVLVVRILTMMMMDQWTQWLLRQQTKGPSQGVGMTTQNRKPKCRKLNENVADI
jgi:hypothetical protein